MAALSLAMLFGCATAERSVASHQVARDFYRHRFDEACHVAQAPKWCAGFDVTLNATDKHLDEGTAALVWVQKSKAKMPLQLQMLKADEKALKAGYKP